VKPEAPSTTAYQFVRDPLGKSRPAVTVQAVLGVGRIQHRLARGVRNRTHEVGDRQRPGRVPCAAGRRSQVLLPRGRVARWAEFSRDDVVNAAAGALMLVKAYTGTGILEAVWG
jgi:hypothetical protein